MFESLDEENEALIVLVTEDEACELHEIAKALDEDDQEGFEWALGQVLGQETLAQTQAAESVILMVAFIPDAVGPDGELVCRIEM